MSRIRDITIDIHHVQRPTFTPRPSRFFTDEPHVYALLRVLTDDGIEGNHAITIDARQGHGAGRHGTYALAAQILGQIKKEIVGRDASEREWLWQQAYAWEFWGHLNPKAIAAVDIALWDIAGKAAGQPVYKLLGAARNRIPAYDNCPFLSEIEPQVQWAQETKRRGFRGLKLHPGTLPMPTILQLHRRVREAVGPDLDLMDDEALTLDYESALRIGLQLQELEYRWFEDPCPHTDVDAYERLCSRLDIPIAWTDHQNVDYANTVAMLRREAGPRIIRGDSMRFGITMLKKLCALAESFGLKCEIHSGNLPNLHVALSTCCCTYFEHTNPLPPGSEIPKDSPFALDANGCVSGPAAPGIGEAVIWQRMLGRKVETLH
jgi:L-alanine-DL-glutamate epimerase-like enolase superfamily enzyme